MPLIYGSWLLFGLFKGLVVRLVTAQTIITESYPIAKRGMAQAIYGVGYCRPLPWPLEAIMVFHVLIFFINIPLGITPF
jgi:DHA2 family multidrug resistance protein